MQNMATHHYNISMAVSQAGFTTILSLFFLSVRENYYSARSLLTSDGPYTEAARPSAQGPDIFSHHKFSQIWKNIFRKSVRSCNLLNNLLLQVVLYLPASQPVRPDQLVAGLVWLVRGTTFQPVGSSCRTVPPPLYEWLIYDQTVVVGSKTSS